MSFIRSDDAAIYYEEYGSGGILILLPDLLGTIETDWRRFIPEFALHFHTIAMDLRGHGRTNNPSGKLRLEALIDDLHALMETLEIERACICGSGFGGYVGLAYGLQHPERVAGLLTYGSRFHWTPAIVSDTITSLNAEAILTNSPEWAELLQRNHSNSDGSDGWKRLVGAVREFLSLMTSDGLSESALAAASFPVLVSVGEFDVTIPRKNNERLVALLPKAELTIMEKATHEMHTVQKTEFLSRAVAFLRPTS